MRTTVLLCPGATLLTELVQVILEDAEDVDLVAVVDLAKLADTARAHDASVAICIGPLAQDAVVETLVARPMLRIIELAQHGRSASVVQLVPRRKFLGELSRELLLTEVHRDVRHGLGDRAD